MLIVYKSLELCSLFSRFCQVPYDPEERHPMNQSILINHGRSFTFSNDFAIVFQSIFVLFFSNSLRPGDAYMHRWTDPFFLTTWWLFAYSAPIHNHYLIPMLLHCQLDLKEYISMKFYLEFFIQENVLGNVVCNIWAICLGPKVLSGFSLNM